MVGRVTLRKRSYGGHYAPDDVYVVLQEEGDETTAHVAKRNPLSSHKIYKQEQEPVTLEEVKNLGRIITETFLQ